MKSRASVVLILVALVLAWATFGGQMWSKYAVEKSAQPFFSAGDCSAVIQTFEDQCAGPCGFESNLLDTCLALEGKGFEHTDNISWLEDRVEDFGSNREISAWLTSRIEAVCESHRQEREWQKSVNRVLTGQASIAEVARFLEKISADASFGEEFRPRLKSVFRKYAKRKPLSYADSMPTLLELAPEMPEIEESIYAIAKSILANESGFVVAHKVWWDACNGQRNPFGVFFRNIKSEKVDLWYAEKGVKFSDERSLSLTPPNILFPSMDSLMQTGSLKSLNPAICVKPHFDMSLIVDTCTYLQNRKRPLVAVDYDIWLVDLADGEKIGQRVFTSAACPFLTRTQEGENVFGTMPMTRIREWAEGLVSQPPQVTQ